MMEEMTKTEAEALGGLEENEAHAEPAAPEAEGSGDGSEDDSYFEELIASDLSELRGLFPELREIESITELENPTRYAALRDLGLSPEEAYKATATALPRGRDNRAHLSPAAPGRRASASADIPFRDMQVARSIFGDLSDSEIRKLYRKVTR
jgi:hypothetical protein